MKTRTDIAIDLHYDITDGDNEHNTIKINGALCDTLKKFGDLGISQRVIDTNHPADINDFLNNPIEHLATLIKPTPTIYQGFSPNINIDYNDDVSGLLSLIGFIGMRDYWNANHMLPSILNISIDNYFLLTKLSNLKDINELKAQFINIQHTLIINNFDPKIPINIFFNSINVHPVNLIL